MSTNAEEETKIGLRAFRPTKLLQKNPSFNQLRPKSITLNEMIHAGYNSDYNSCVNTCCWFYL